MLIKNYKKLATSELRKKALDIVSEGMAGVTPDILMRNTVRYNEVFNNLIILNKNHDMISGRIFVIGGGKAAGQMALTLEEIMSPKFLKAGVVTSWSSKYKTKKIKIIKAGHPWPDEKGIKGVNEMLKLKTKYNIGKKDLVICLLSGGGSAMLPRPAEGITLEEKKAVTELLISSGADINEINKVRKHISQVKGGRLAGYFAPAKVISIIISDVIGNDVEIICSGPTVPDKSTYHDAYDVLDKFKLIHKVPKSVVEHIEKGMQLLIEDTPKKLENSQSYVIADNTTALEVMATKARAMGFKPLIITTALIGDARDSALQLAENIRNGKYSGYDVLLFGGETTVKITGQAGEGGRNMHFVASFVEAFKYFDRDWAILSFSSDGRDFLTGFAGAIADRATWPKAEDRGLDIARFIKTFNTLPLFKKLGENLILTGDTGTNIADIGMFIIK